MNDVTIVVSSYKAHKLIALGFNNEETCAYITNISRAMGMGQYKDRLYVSNLGQLLCYKNIGPDKNRQFGEFTCGYYPQFCYVAGDVDIHDIKVTENGIFYISALCNCIAIPSLTKTFEVYWKPPWISTDDNGTLKAEDRCHINGLCCIDGWPRYVTCVSDGDVLGHWRSHTNRGFVYDIVEGKKICENIWSPHSPNWYDGRLWILQSGTGEFGYVDLEKKEFISKVFLPGFLRGMTFHNDYALICLSKDRHDHAFKDLPLSDKLLCHNTKACCGIRIVDMKTMSVKYELDFQDPSGITELYDIVCIPGHRSRILDVNDSDVLERFYPPNVKDVIYKTGSALPSKPLISNAFDFDKEYYQYIPSNKQDYGGCDVAGFAQFSPKETPKPQEAPKNQEPPKPQETPKNQEPPKTQKPQEIAKNLKPRVQQMELEDDPYFASPKSDKSEPIPNKSILKQSSSSDGSKKSVTFGPF